MSEADHVREELRREEAARGAAPVAVGSCPNCNRTITDWHTGTACPACGNALPTYVTARLPQRAGPSIAEQRGESERARPASPSAVVLTGLDVPFGQLVMFIARWMVASIFAALLVSPILLIFGALFFALLDWLKHS